MAFEWTTADEQRFREMCGAAAEQMEVYRKALEPFARFFADVQGAWIEVCPDDEERRALREACRLMGIDIPETRGED